MKNIKTFEEFNNLQINESFTISLEQLPSIGDIVDKVDWKEGDNVAFIDFKGIKNIPVRIESGSENSVESGVESGSEVENVE
jgi:hypothetical protein